MSLYISNRQPGDGNALDMPYVPTLMGLSNCNFKHRIFSPYYKFSKLIIDSYEIANRKNTEIIYPIIPTGSITFVFLFGHGMKGTVWGCNSTIRYLYIPVKTNAYCVRLRPGAFRCFSEMDVSELENRIVPMEQLLKNTEKLCLSLRYAESFHERNVMVQRFLESVHGQDFQPAGKIQSCLSMIEVRKGVIKVCEIAEQLHCSTRYVNRLFSQHVGIAPKIYCQLMQLQLSLKNILEYHPKSLLDTAVSHGYFDQAHMNRSFRKFLNCTAYDVKNFSGQDVSQKELLLDQQSASVLKKVACVRYVQA
jgi:AraC-like DNA-binding protein